MEMAKNKDWKTGGKDGQCHYTKEPCPHTEKSREDIVALLVCSMAWPCESAAKRVDAQAAEAIEREERDRGYDQDTGKA